MLVVSAISASLGHLDLVDDLLILGLGGDVALFALPCISPSVWSFGVPVEKLIGKREIMLANLALSDPLMAFWLRTIPSWHLRFSGFGPVPLSKLHDTVFMVAMQEKSEMRKVSGF
jgi:hypothetical protein